MKNAKRIIIFILIGILIGVFGVFYLLNSSLQDSSIRKLTNEKIIYMESSFNNLVKLDTKMLSSTLEVISRDNEIKNIYLGGNRAELYEHSISLFNSLKENYGITHWYFISLDGKVFLRMHNKDIYDDDVDRFTFLSSQNSKEISSGIELGKTAYALRVVMPYYNGDELIGYIELGEEIDHFFDILEEATDHKFILAVEKSLINEKDWRSVRDVASLEDNWDDSYEHIMISSLDAKGKVLDCFSDDNINNGLKGQWVFQNIESDDRHFRCAGFVLTDAGERDSGIIFSLIDIDSFRDSFNDFNFILIGFLLLVFIFIIMILFLFSILYKRS